MATLEHEFSLDGMLVFDGLYECRVPGELDFETVLLSLPGFEGGSPESPGDGFTRLPLNEVLGDRPNPEGMVRDEVTAFDHVRYTVERYDRTVADVEGERRPVSVPSEQHADLHWRFPELLAVRGNRVDAEQAVGALSASLDDAVEFDEIGFESAFLRALVTGGTSMPDGFALSRTTELDVRSTVGKFEQRNRIADEGGSLGEAELSAAFGEDGRVTGAGGEFSLDGHEIHATVSVEGRVHVRAAGDLRPEDDYGRVFLGLAFLSRLVRTYRRWERNE
jgi:hypothetical protein